MVAPQEHGFGVFAPEIEQELDHGFRIPPPVDEIAQKDDFILCLEGHALHQGFEHMNLAVDVADRVEIGHGERAPPG